MTAPVPSLLLRDEHATIALARRVGARLEPGDTLLLEGDIGAGKSFFARALIQSLQEVPEHVPSPTFTLVQTYDTTKGEIWHADLYRLGDPGELHELGLTDAFDSAICLIEWPDRLGSDCPPQAATLRFDLTGHQGARRLTILSGPAALLENSPDWTNMPDRETTIRRFLGSTNWASAARAPLAGDASMRKYQRLGPGRDGRIAVLMDADPALGNDVRPFQRITDYLRSINLSAPEIFAADAANGLLVLEDLGDALFARAALDDPALETPLYEAATDVLLHLHSAPPPALDPYDTAFMTRMAALSFDWYQRGAHAAVDARAKHAFEQAFSALLDTEIDPPDVLIQRDYHAENLLWLPARTGIARVGLLDYQDALLGHRAYDLVSLLKDARRDVPHAVEETMIARYVAASGMDETRFRTAYHLLGLQRNLRILGVFARLSMHFAKPHYVDLIPRVWRLIERDLDEPACAPVAGILRGALPEPTPEILQRLKDKCGTIQTL